MESNSSSRRLAFVGNILLFVGMISIPGHAFHTSRAPFSRISPSRSRNTVPNTPIQNIASDWSTIRKPDILCYANRRSVKLTSMSNDDHANNSRKFRLRQCILTAVEKFKSRPSAYLLIPVIAAFVGWFTNYLAVQMIFYPIEFRGIPIWRKDELPLGLIGWQGIVPCKTRVMSETMVTMVTTQLLNIEEVFRRLDPNAVAEILSPEVPKLMQSIGSDMSPVGWLPKISKCLFFSFPMKTISTMSTMNHKFLHDFTVAMQDNIGALLNVKNCVVHQMMEDKALLGQLFRKCGQKELDFLTNSGLWFGFLLGLIQMVVALFWENPWASPIGGTIVGLATNWLALKWIFEPVNPTKVGPFILQGQFLRRQKEVAAEFSSFFANNVLTSEKLWDSILNDLTTKPSFDLLFKKHLRQFAYGVAGGFGLRLPSQFFNNVASLAVEKLPNHLHVLHPYVDNTLKLQSSLRTQMEKMTSAKFERVLHPIFEEDELTLIVAGGVLGFIAGLIQGGIESGEVQKWVGKKWKSMQDLIRRKSIE
ncbi:hypothetical protein HJC23_010135 [Cyclotella cryptica]|uniref:DUF445 domain-containing protein n=1 Tax=Cyclotella cryptica TaxID=29204 RepID=A0ABD3NGY1_9STRA|eukprot:CCRYP_021000-RB/>CCRYP_021000-RB protein AED:0.29 eAED:0.29 QI:221/1/1/1/0.33/0/4/1905/533